MKYIEGTKIPEYVLKNLLKYQSTVISRASVMKYKTEGIKEIFKAQGHEVDISMTIPIHINQTMPKKGRTSLYPVDATFIISLQH